MVVAHQIELDHHEEGREDQEIQEHSTHKPLELATDLLGLNEAEDEAVEEDSNIAPIIVRSYSSPEEEPLKERSRARKAHSASGR